MPCHKQPSVLILRKLLPVLALLLGSLTLGVPAAASNMHQLAHAQTVVAAGEHHHHSATGEVDLHGHEQDEQSGDRGDLGVGHNHSSASSGDLATTPAVSALSTSLGQALLLERSAAELPTVDPPPQERPPRTA